MNSLELEVKFLKEENEKLKECLENYNNSRKNYYEKNKEIVKEKAKKELKRIKEENPEKIKEYAKRAYLKQKEKKNRLLEDNENNS
jgi:ribosomal protein S17E